MILDLTLKLKKLTQGQPPAEMVVRKEPGEPAENPPEVTLEPSKAVALTLANTSGTTPKITPQAVANRVYELMRQELRREHDRRGGEPL